MGKGPVIRSGIYCCVYKFLLFFFCSLKWGYFFFFFFPPMIAYEAVGLFILLHRH